MSEENNKPFRQTKKLIRLALDDGWTQKEIAGKARVQQSVVSGWATGKAKAKRHQIEFLLEEYGSQLRKLSTSVYCTQHLYYELSPKILSFFESCGVDVHPLEGKDNISFADARKLLRGKCSEAQLQQFNEFEQLSDEVTTQVEAPIIFKFTFQDEVVRYKQRKKISTERWILHSLSGQRFVLAIQSRRQLSDQQLEAEMKRRKGFRYLDYDWPRVGIEDIFITTCNDEAARWYTTLCEFNSVETIIQKVCGILESRQSDALYNMQDLTTLPFLLKKALCEAGFHVKGVRKITAY